MRNNKGFTLIEIICAIIILSVISIIAFTTYTGNLRGFRDDYYVSAERTYSQSGREFFNDNRNFRPNVILGATKVSLSTLNDKKYIDDFVDYNGESCSNESYVVVIKMGEDDYIYNTCLVCPADSYSNIDNKYCDPDWLSYSNITYSVGTISDLYIYKGTPRADVRKQLEIPVSYIKKNRDGKVLGEVVGTGLDNMPKILPKNIDIVDTSKVGDYKLYYEFVPVNVQTGLAEGDAEKREATVHVYENAAPTYAIEYQNDVATNFSGTTTLEKGTYNSTDWVQSVVVTLNMGNTISDPNAKFSKYQWFKDGRWQDFCEQANCVKTVTTEMNEVVQFRMVDTKGNISQTTEKRLIKIDNTKPKCELDLEGTIPDGWYTSNVKVTFKIAEDQLGSSLMEAYKSGISSKYITLYTTSTPLSRTTSNTEQIQDKDGDPITYKGYIEDNAKNFSYCTVVFKRDATNPTCSITPSGVKHARENRYLSNVVMTISTNDNLSKVKTFGITTYDNIASKTHSTNSFTAVTYNGHVMDYATNTGACSISYVKEDSLTLSYNSNGGSSCASKTIHYNTAYGTLCTTTRRGYDFVNWMDTNNSAVVSTNTVKVIDNQTITAKWDPIKYTVKYNCGAGTGTIANETATYDSNYTVNNGNNCTRTGYTFAGWTTKSNYTDDGYGWSTFNTKWTLIDGEKGISNRSVQLYAMWTANPYTISYTMNNGSKGTNAPTSATYDVVFNVSNPSKSLSFTYNKNSTGATLSNSSDSCTQTFAGWTFNGNTSTAKYGTTTSPVTAWSPATTKVKGTYFKNLTPTKNATVTLTANWNTCSVTLPTITKTGYTCNFNTASNGTGTTYNPGATFTPVATSGTSHTLYVRCTPNTYTITYDSNGGTACTSKTGTYGSTWGTLCTPTKTNNTFNGWYDSSGNNITSTSTVSGNLSVTARWTLNSVQKTGTLYLSGYKSSLSGTLTAAASVLSSPALSASATSGSVSCSASGSTISCSVTGVAKSKTLTKSDCTSLIQNKFGFSESDIIVYNNQCYFRDGKGPGFTGSWSCGTSTSPLMNQYSGDPNYNGSSQENHCPYKAPTSNQVHCGQDHGSKTAGCLSAGKTSGTTKYCKCYAPSGIKIGDFYETTITVTYYV